MKKLLILLIVLVVLYVLWYLNKYTKKEKFTEQAEYPFGGEYPRICPVDQDYEQVNQYVIKNLLNNKQKEKSVKCSRPVNEKIIDDYRNKFFDFRNHVWNTSHQEDTVDRVAKLYLDGNLDISRTRRGEQIRDVYDELTGAHQFQKICTALPNEVFDTYEKV